ncbi:hypothetical protein ABPG72_016737 [Tetrahymena utriculariae]
MSRDDQNKLNLLGLMMIVSLSVFNTVFLISFIYDIVKICIECIQQQLNKGKLIVSLSTDSIQKYRLEENSKNHIIITNSNIPVQDEQQKEQKSQHNLSFVERYFNKKVKNLDQKQNFIQLSYISNLHSRKTISNDQS